MTDITSEYVLQIPVVEAEDVSQEMALYELTTGKKASSRVAYQALALKANCFTFSGQLPYGRPLVERDDEAQERASLALREWATTHGEKVQIVIDKFLENPSEEALAIATAELKKQKLLSREAERSALKPKKVSFRDALRAFLRAHPGQSREQLMAWARQVQRSERPEKVLRGAIRKMALTGELTNDELGNYYINE